MMNGYAIRQAAMDVRRRHATVWFAINEASAKASDLSRSRRERRRWKQILLSLVKRG
jgi:hypothetical protein